MLLIPKNHQTEYRVPFLIKLCVCLYSFSIPFNAFSNTYIFNRSLPFLTGYVMVSLLVLTGSYFRFYTKSFNRYTIPLITFYTILITVNFIYSSSLSDAVDGLVAIPLFTNLILFFTLTTLIIRYQILFNYTSVCFLISLSLINFLSLIGFGNTYSDFYNLANMQLVSRQEIFGINANELCNYNVFGIKFYFNR